MSPEYKKHRINEVYDITSTVLITRRCRGRSKSYKNNLEGFGAWLEHILIEVLANLLISRIKVVKTEATYVGEYTDLKPIYGMKKEVA